MKRKYSLKLLVIGVLLVVVIPPVVHLFKTKWKENKVMLATPNGYTNDASQLNLTPIDSLLQVKSDPEALVLQLQQILQYAKNNNLKVSIAGAQHSMGGHSMYPGGIVVNMLNYKRMELDEANNTLTIGSGALWEDAIRYLDQYGKSIAVMQAFSSFSVGGSLSVNGHGWQNDSPPIASSVLSFTLMEATGEIVTCSRTENAELFHLVLGGYGLFGILLDVKLKVVDNAALQYKYVKVSPEKYIAYYKKWVVNRPNVNLVFGRLRISDKQFLEEATLHFFETVDAAPPVLSGTKSTEAQRLVFRSSVNSEYGKRLRWNLESGMNTMSKNQIYSRNELLNDSVNLIENKDSTSTDLLQEYFIPERHFVSFIADIKPILQRAQVDLLNITIRHVKQDDDTVLNYAQEDVFGFVFLFNQKKTAQQEHAMQELTQQLFEAAKKNQGTFYLPYRLHLTKTQMRDVYPKTDHFFTLKKYYDPDEVFYNRFYEHYR